MKYTQLAGILAALLLVVVCTLHWIYIPSLNIYLSGLQGHAGTDLNFGSQIKPHGFFATMMIVCFFVERVWTKRLNVFLGAINLAWAFKNFIIFSMCRGGECPEKQPALYGLVLIAAIMLLMSLFPKMKLASKK